MSSIIIQGMAFALPLFIIAIGGIYSERSGITNLALEGFLGFGAFFGAAVVMVMTGGNVGSLEIPMFFVALIFAAIGGALFAMLHALLCIPFKANQVISGVVINILAVALTAFFTSQINTVLLGKPTNKFMLGVCHTFTVPGISKIPVLGAFFTDVYYYIPIIIIIALFMTYLLYRSRFGLRLRACGDNPHAVDAAGADVSKIRFIAVMISGAMSGVGGICFAYSISSTFSPSIYAGYGFLAIAALIFGNWKIGPTLGACLLFGFARSAGYKLAQILGLSSAFSDIIMILPYVLTLLLLVFFSSSNRAPRALGEIYDKGKR
ncbi:MAG: ABC transporter permease [Firmicutes bacterium HGW-Firmicutes-16]|nr:MAG: ABC transporter permease [Firmicutes bacterium HGW-Firmicutes-16]